MDSELKTRVVSQEDRSDNVDSNRRNVAFGLFGILGGAALIKGCASEVVSGAPDDVADEVSAVAEALTGSTAPVWFDTYAELKTFSGGPLSTSQNVAIGRDVLIGGTFGWSTDVVTADNGGTVIVPTASPRTGCWKRLFSGPLNVKWFGAKGNGSTDDTAAIQAATNTVAQTGGEVLFPPGQYVISQIVVPVNSPGIAWIGQHWNGDTQTKNAALIHTDPIAGRPMITSSGSGYVNHFGLKNFVLISTGNVGHCIDMSGQMISFMSLENITFAPNNSSALFWYVGASLAHLSVRNFYVAQPPTNPLFNIKNNVAGSNTFQCVFENGVLNGGISNTQPMIVIESASAHASWGPVFRNLTFEIPGGGGIRILSNLQCTFDTLIFDDLAPNPPANPMIELGQSPSGIGQAGSTFLNCWIAQGTAAKPDVKQTSSTGMVVINSLINFLDAQGQPPVVIGEVFGVGYVGTTKPLRIRADGTLTGVRGISSTNTASSGNFSGSTTVSGASGSAISVNFPTAEPDASYQIMMFANSHTGSPNASAYCARIETKATSGFTWLPNSYPGAGTSVTFLWMLVR